jgi:hypothetical protein
MKARYRPSVESLESKISLSADLGSHPVAALREAPRLVRRLDPSNFQLQGTVVGFMKVESIYGGESPGPVGARRFTILGGRGRVSGLGPVRVGGTVFEATPHIGSFVPPVPPPHRPSGGVVLRSFQGTEVELEFQGAVVPPGTAFTDGPNYFAPDFVTVNHSYQGEEDLAGVVSLSFPRGQPAAYSRPMAFVMHILIASKPADGSTS